MAKGAISSRNKIKEKEECGRIKRFMAEIRGNKAVTFGGEGEEKQLRKETVEDIERMMEKSLKTTLWESKNGRNNDVREENMAGRQREKYSNKKIALERREERESRQFYGRESTGERDGEGVMEGEKGRRK